MGIINVPNMGDPGALATLAGQQATLSLFATTETIIKGGANLTDADATIQPATDKASQYVLPAATLTTNRTVTLGTTSALTGLMVRIVRRDRTANTLAIGAMFTFGASPTADMEAWFLYNGSYWVFLGAQYIQ